MDLNRFKWMIKWGYPILGNFHTHAHVYVEYIYACMNIYVYVHWRWGKWLSSKASEHYFLYHCYGSFFLWFSICLQQKVTARFMKDNHTTNTFFNHVIQYGANNGGWDKQIAAWNMEELTPANLNNLECIHTHIYTYICIYINIYIHNSFYM